MSSLSQIQVEKIVELVKHPNADTLSIATLSNGFQLVVKNDQFVSGEKVGFCPTDMLAPQTDEYEYLGSSRRVKAKKIRGIISVGLALKLEDQSIPLGRDLTEFYGFRPYEPLDSTVTMGGIQVKAPIEMSKYDIDSLRKYHSIFNLEIVALEKVHGCFGGAVYLQQREKFYLKSKNRWLAHDGESLWSKVAIKYNLEEKCRLIPNRMILFEIFGWVQDLRYGAKSGEYFIAAFDVYNTDRNEFFNYDSFAQICDGIEFPRVPEIYRGPWLGIQHIAELAERKTEVGFDKNQMAEGVVVKLTRESWDQRIGRVILKYPSQQYLLR